MIRLLRYCIFLVILSACASHLHISEVKSTHYELKAFKNDSIANLNILPYKEKLDVEMNVVIAYSDSALTRDGYESSLGNFVLLAVKEYVKTNNPEIAGNCVLFVNRGGLRNNLPKGAITKGNIFELMPFDNELVSLNISGEKLKESIEAMLKDNKLISFDLRMDVKNKQVENIIVNGSPFDLNKNYWVVTTDYLAMGGDNCGFFGKPISYETTGIKLRDAIITYCGSLTKNNTHIKPLRFEQIKFSK
ncbi:MAG TPA: 5'-nucleotidase [Bacteroidia bacterium]|jgi:2',3'-cyclic-nucleotide 2'-phosphodiesterase (5'-nucleotidase family)|nr:5'-nucleotidase [Bacteroidia bacterium]